MNNTIEAKAFHSILPQTIRMVESIQQRLKSGQRETIFHFST